MRLYSWTESPSQTVRPGGSMAKPWESWMLPESYFLCIYVNVGLYLLHITYVSYEKKKESPRLRQIRGGG